MKRSLPSLLEIAVVAYCVWQARDLPESWIGAPLVRYNWISMIIWLLPVLYYAAYATWFHVSKENSVVLIAAAVIISTLGELGSLHALTHLGLALALAGMLPITWPMVIWIPAAISWFPALGWFLREFSRLTIFELSIATAFVGTISMFALSTRIRKRV